MLYSNLYPLLEYYPHLVQIYHMKVFIREADQLIEEHKPNYVKNASTDVQFHAVKATHRLQSERSQRECIRHSCQIYVDQIDKNKTITETRKEFEFIATLLELDYMQFLNCISNLSYIHQKQYEINENVTTCAWMRKKNYLLIYTPQPNNSTHFIKLIMRGKDKLEIVARRLKIHRLLE